MNRRIYPILRARELLEGDRVHAAEYVSFHTDLPTELWVIGGPKSSLKPHLVVPPGLILKGRNFFGEVQNLIPRRIKPP